MTENNERLQPAAASDAEHGKRKGSRLRAAIAVLLAALLVIGLLAAPASAATTYSDAVSVSGSYGYHRIKLDVTVDNSYSNTQAKVTWTATSQMKSAYQWGIKLTCMGQSSTGVLTSSPGSSYKTVCSVSGSAIVNKSTSSTTYTVSASAAGATVNGYGGAKKSTSVSYTVTINPISEFTNTINHWSWGFENGEGNNGGSNNAFKLGSTTFKAQPGAKYTMGTSRAMTIPNGHELRTAWRDSSKGVEHTMGETFTQPSYANSFEYRYDPITYSITYNMNGGTNASSNPTSYNVLYGVELADPAARPGYRFTGWSYESMGRTVTMKSGSFDFDGSSLQASSGVSSSGVFGTYSGYAATPDLIPVTGGTVLESSMEICGIYSYDASGNFIRRESSYATVHPISANAAYIRVEVNTSDATLSNYKSNLKFTQTAGVNAGCNATFSSADDLYARLKTRTTGNLTITANWEPYEITVNQRTNGADYGTFKGEDLGLTGADALADSWTLAYDSSTSLWNAQTSDNLYISRTGYSPTGYWGTSKTGGTLVHEDDDYTGKQLAEAVGKSIESADASVNLYAQWRAHEYDVVYDANGGKGDAMASTHHVYDVAQTLPANTYVFDGYRFAGWNTEPDGSGTAYSDAQSAKNITAEDGATVTLYAQWDPHVLTVRYHSNGADACTLAGAAVDVTPGSDAVVHTECFRYGTVYADGLSNAQNPGLLNITRAGHTSTGYWATAPDGGVYVHEETGFNSGQALAAAFGLALVEGDCEVDVYPQWKVNSYKVVFDSNGGKGKIASSKHTYDETWTLPTCTITNAGCFFDGWNTEADGSGTAYADRQEVSGLASANGATVTLYAQWAAGSYAVSFDGNGADSGSLPDAEYEHNEVWKVPGNPFEKTATVTFDANGGTASSALPSFEHELEFVNWSKRPDGRGGAYAEGQSVVNVAGSSKAVTLYAQWEPVEVTMPEAPVNGDYVFAGWYAGEAAFAGEDLYQPGDVVKVSDDAAFYAHWRPADVVIVYADGRIVLEEEPAADGTYSVTDAAIAAATREGCEGLDGFYSDADCTVPFRDGALVDGELRIYARNPVTISFGIVEGSIVEGLDLFSDEDLEVPVEAEALLPSPIKTYYGQVIGAPTIEDAYCSEHGQARAVAATPGVYADASGSGELLPEVTATAPATYYFDFTLGGTVVVLEYATAAYTVEYDINGGSSGETPDSEHLWGHAKRLTPNGYSRDFHVFTGWNAEPDGTGEAFEDSQYVANLTSEDGATVTLYAQWRPWTYHVNYHPNGATEGTVEPSPQTFGTVGTISDNGFSEDGWTFLRWNTEADGSGEDFFPGQSILNLCTEDDALFDLYAIWDVGEYTVSYDANGGEGKMDPSTHVYGKAKKLTKSSFTRTGYEFEHWATSPDGTGEAYSDEQEVVNLTDVDGAEIPLFAQWDPVSYAVHYDSNGGSGTTTSSFHVYDVPKNLTPNGFTKADCRFTGWNTEPDGTGEPYADSQEVVNLASTEGAEVTLYAQWEEIPASELIRYTIVYEANGADSGSMEPSSHTVGFPSTLSANAYGKTGSLFAGWNTEPDGSGAAYSNRQRVDFQVEESGAVIVLYAQWDPVSYDVVYDGNGSDGGQTWGVTLEFDEEGAVAENGFTRTGYSYVKWNTEPDGSGTDYSAGDRILRWSDESGSVITLYAQWTPIEYDVAYAGGEADSGETESSHHVYDEPKPLTENGYGRTGYTFAGWMEEGASQRTFTDGQEVVNLTATDGDTVVLEALWAPIAYFVSYDANGGEGKMDPSTHTYDIAKNLTENGYTRSVTATFDGNGGSPASSTKDAETPFNLWTTNADGSGKAYADAESVTNLSAVNLSTVTMYAQWSPGKVTLPAAPTHSELVFTGWYDAASGGELIGQPGDTVEISSDTTFYAHWRPPAVVLVHADGELVLEEYPGEDGIYSVTDAAVEAATRPSCEGLNGWFLDEDCTIPLPAEYLIEGEVSIYTRNIATVTFEESDVSATIGRTLYADEGLEDAIGIYDVIPEPVRAYYGDKIAVPDMPGVWFVDAGYPRYASAGSGAYATPNATGTRLSEARVLGTATLWYDWQVGGYDGILTD